MSIQLQEIQSIYISQNRLVEGKDYVRAEWLKKSGLARIDIPTNYNMVDSVTCYFKHYGGTTGQMPVFGGNKIHGLLWQLLENSSTDKSNKLDTYFNNQYFFNISAKEGKFKVKFNWQTKKRLISWNDVSKGGWLSCALDKTNTKISVLDCWRFNQSWHTHSGALAMKYFFLAPNIYLYPCQLLQDIPATLDANGIARTAGECGMIDSISGKFYGNVASSGSFTVENLDESGTVEDTRLHQIYRNKLVEGEDYIVGEMLKGDDNSPYISIPNFQNFNLEAHRTNTTNYTLIEGTYTQYQGTTYTAYINYINQINRTSADVTAGVFKATVAISNDVTIEKRYKVGYDALKFNGANCVRNASEPVYNGIDLRTVTKLLANANSYIVSLKGNRTYANSDEWKYTFVPCRLLRPIPRNLDAQCKSRQTGECGMIDLISGRFYGNVASSGAFSLAWDEWLKDCSIQFDANYLGWTMQYPPTITYKGRVRVANLPDELTDFGFVKLSKTQVVMGENVWSFNNWGSGTWASFDVSYGGGGGCGCSINGSSVGSQQEQVATELSCSIDLQDIIQINEIEFIAYIDQQTTHTVKFTRGFDETLNKQYLISDYDNTRIYAD